MGSLKELVILWTMMAIVTADYFSNSYTPAPYHDGYDYSGGNYYNSPNYRFQYQVHDYHGNDYGHQESRKGDETTGKYQVLLPDGRTQVVTYVADKGGYRAKVSYIGGSRHHDTYSGYNKYKPSSSYPYY